MEKRSQGHVEIVLSFIIFIGFLIFVFIFFDPLFKTEGKLSITKERGIIIDETSATVGKIFIIVYPDNKGKPCSSLSTEINSYGNNYAIVKDTADGVEPVKYTVYYGSFLIPENINEIVCDGLSNSYVSGVYTKEYIIVREYVKSLKSSYENDYTALRNLLGLRDFLFVYRNLDGSVIPELSINENSIMIPKNINIISVDIPVRVIDSSARIEEMRLNIKKW